MSAFDWYTNTTRDTVKLDEIKKTQKIWIHENWKKWNLEKG